MLCKCCRQDLPKECYGASQYKCAILHGNTQFCAVCVKLTKKQKRAKAADALAGFNFPVGSRKQKKQAKLSEEAAAEARWRHLSMEEKRLDLISRQTPSECALASAMRDAGINFEPQVRVCHFYLDFHVLPHLIDVEVDGGYHFRPKQQESDRKRDKTLQKRGWTILRITNERVKDELPAVIAEIQRAMDHVGKHPPLPKKWPKPPKIGAIGRKATTHYGIVVIPPRVDFPFGANAELAEVIARDSRYD